MPKKTFNVKELSMMLGFTKHTIYDWVRKAKIPYLRVGNGHIRFDPIEVGRALRQERPPARAA